MLMKKTKTKSKPRLLPRLYFDYAASTPLDPRVARVMRAYEKNIFGNAGSLHYFGQQAIAALDRHRQQIADATGADFDEIIFVPSATIANNMAIAGAVSRFRREHPGCTPHIIVSALEHESVAATARALESDGVRLDILRVDRAGRVREKILTDLLTPDTVLVCVMAANNEVGTIQPIPEIAGIIKQFKLSEEKNKNGNTPYPLLHMDASQAFQFMPPAVPDGVDLVTISSHKIYGPKGIACLYVRQNKKNNYPIAPIIFGGGQEYGLCSGTQNIPAIAGFAKAVELAALLRQKEADRVAALKKYLWHGIKKINRNIAVNGVDPDSAQSERYSLPHILNVYISKTASQELLTRLDLAGIAASSGSACAARALVASHVILAMGYSKERAQSSVRFSLGRPTQKKDIDYLLSVLKKILLTQKGV